MSTLDDLKHRFDTFRALMPHKIREILLVSSAYDAYVLEEDGSLEERIWDQYMERGLSSVPRIRKVSTIDGALDIVHRERVDLVLTILHDESDMASQLAERIREARADLPVVFLVTDPDMLAQLPPQNDSEAPGVFLWQNDPALLLAIVKSYEDRLNVAHDTELGKVRVILLVEDSVSHYSSFLPLMYTSIMRLTNRLMDDSLNHLHRQLRMRSRAKILLADSFEKAMEFFHAYRPYLLGVVTDVRFRRNGDFDDNAGFELTRRLREKIPELPVCIQSAEPEKNRSSAHDIDTHFLDKNSIHLLEDLERWLMDCMGFGDFVFRDSQGHEILRVSTPGELIDALKTVPMDSVIRHARHQDFSHWMMARTEIAIAERLSPARVEDFRSDEDIRRHIMHVIETVQYEKQSDVITHYSPGKNPFELQFMRLGSGSLGGKARGIGFLRYLLSRLEIRRDFPDIGIEIPPTLVICADKFTDFVDRHDLWDFALDKNTRQEDIRRRFLELPVQNELIEDLRHYLRFVQAPLAVRSSSMMEDSRNFPLAGLYSTYMLRNNEEDLERRLEALLRAIKLVWASTFGSDPKAYFRQTAYRLKDERMAVVVQTLAGSNHGGDFYPTFSGVAQSHNFYPVSYMKPEDGVAQIALGLGKTVVEGGAIVRFCPKYPQVLPQFAKIRDYLYFTQKDFYALDMHPIQEAVENTPSQDDDLVRLPLERAERHGVLQHVASVYQSESEVLVDSFFYEGPRIVTFMKVLRDPRLRLGELLGRLLAHSQYAMRTPVEIEFAVDLHGGNKPIVYPLQLRPMASKSRWEKIRIEPELKKRAVCYSNQTHGNGIVRNISDVVYVRPDAFDTAKTTEIAREIGEFNRKLVEARRPYLLVGFGRWGSTDPSMGIGVRWSQISGVKVLVEAGLEAFNVDPAQGTHFFQNVTSLNIGCLSVPYDSESFFHWDWLEERPPVEQTRYLKHVRLESPLDIRIDGREGEAVIALGD